MTYNDFFPKRRQAFLLYIGLAIENNSIYDNVLLELLGKDTSSIIAVTPRYYNYYYIYIVYNYY